VREPSFREIVLFGKRFLKETQPSVNYLCATIVELFRLQIVVILRETDDEKPKRMEFLGHWSHSNTQKGIAVDFSSLPEEWRKFINGEYVINNLVQDTYCLHKEEDREQFRPFFQPLSCGPINQVGLVRFAWASDKGRKKFLCIVGSKKTFVPEKDSKPLFDKEDLKFLQEFLEVFTAYISQKQIKEKAFRQALSKDSRLGLMRSAGDLISDGSFGSPSDGKQDYAQSVCRDMATQLMILPRKKDDGEADLKGVVVTDNYPLTQLATIRSECFKGERKELPSPDETIRRIWMSTDAGKRDFVFPYDGAGPTGKDDLPDRVQTQRREFAVSRWLPLEMIRTCFFCLHHRASRKYPAWNSESIANLTDVLVQKIGDQSLIEITAGHLEAFLTAWNGDDGLYMTSDWLTGWFGLKLLRSKLLNSDIRDNAYSPNELSELYKHIGCYFLYVLHWMEYGGSPQRLFSDVEKGYESVVESTLFLICEYAHTELGLPRNITLFKILRKMWSSEAVLYTVHQTYREHLHHAVDICFIGWFLIECDFFKRTLNNGVFEPNDLRNWILAALLHDAGYGLNLSLFVLEHLDFLKKSEQLAGYLDDLKTSINKRSTELCGETQLWMPRHKIPLDKVDHGVMSAMFALSLNGDPFQDHNKWWLSSITDALKAMIQHNLPMDMINPSGEPLSFLLILCDHLQEWDRPRLNKDFLYGLSANLLRTPSPPISSTTLIKYLKINVQYVKPHGRWKFTGRDIQFELQFKDAVLEDFEPSMIWCNHFFDLQKIEYKDLKEDISISFVHPFPDKFKKSNLLKKITEFNILQDFVRNEEEISPFYNAFFAAVREGSRLKYNSLPGEEERFTITLKHGQDVDQKDLARALPDGLYPRFMKWKKERLDNIKIKKVDG
jgi:hypothetical protein